MPSRLWIPLSQRAAGYNGLCRICHRTDFRDQNDHIRHVAHCSEVHADELEVQARRRRDWNTPIDPEWEAYNQDLRSRGIDPMKQYDKRLKKPLRES